MLEYAWVVKGIRQSKWLMSGIVSLTLLGWVLASNHCGLAGLFYTASPKAEHSCCHQEEQPGPMHMVQCCDTLSAPLPFTAVAPDPSWSELFAIPYITWKPLPSLVVVEARDYESLAPPGNFFFTSIVLKRSTPSLAPPALVA